MTNAICGTCGTAVDPRSATYDRNGHWICVTCAARATLAETEASGDAQRRRGIITAAILAVLLVVVAATLFATGNGRFVGHALALIGIVLLVGGMSAVRTSMPWFNPFPTTFTPPPHVIKGGVMMVVLGVLCLSAAVALQGVH